MQGLLGGCFKQLSGRNRDSHITHSYYLFNTLVCHHSMIARHTHNCLLTCLTARRQHMRQWQYPLAQVLSFNQKRSHSSTCQPEKCSAQQLQPCNTATVQRLHTPMSAIRYCQWHAAVAVCAKSGLCCVRTHTHTPLLSERPSKLELPALPSSLL